MALAPGTRLGPYEVVSPLGAGGMGEVYRARDERLGRDVAIKILSASGPGHDDRLWRFEQEARAVATLNHPNILAIYDVDTRGSTPFLVTELLDGESLRDRLDKGAIPPRKAREIAEQIAHALAAAHDRQIAHRDLKPENVFVTPTGRIKLLDFGLAKLTAPQPLHEGEVTVGTRTVRGTVMGTVGYMSPEQVRGEEVDHRSDIFSFGAVLYEMLAGRRVFAGDSSVETMNAILKEDPRDLPASLNVAPGLERIVRRCLEKNREERFQSARDLAFALSALSESGASGAVGATFGSHRRWLMAGLTLAAAMAVIATGIVAMTRRESPPGRPMHFALPVPGEISQLALSRDGTWLVFVTPDDVTGKNMLYVQRIGEKTPTVLRGTEGASYPFWSSDNAYIGFFADGRLQKIKRAGGAAQVIVQTTLAPRGATWSAQDVIVYAPAAGGPLWRVNADGTEAAPVTDKLLTLEETSHRWPVFLPDGDRFLFWGGRFSRDVPESGIYLSSLSKRQKTFLVNAFSNAGLAPGPSLVYVDEKGRLVMRRLDSDSGRLGGDVRVVADVVGFQPSVYWGAFSVSDTGTVVSNPSSVASQSILTWYDRQGKKLGPIGQSATLYNPALSPDGQRVAADIADTKAANVDVWIFDSAGGPGARFTFAPVEESTPVWSPDGRRIAYQSSETGTELKSATGLEQARLIARLPTRENNIMPDSWSPDGTYLVTHMLAGSRAPSRLYLLKIGDSQMSRLLSTKGNENNGQISPDGKWLAYASDESGDWNVYVTTFPAAAGKWQVSPVGGTEPRWRGDGHELFYLDAKNVLTAVKVDFGATFTVGPPQPLFPVLGRAPISNTDVVSYDVTKDGQRFIVNTYVKPSSVPPLDIVLNATGVESAD